MPEPHDPEAERLARTFRSVVDQHGPTAPDWEGVRRRVSVGDTGSPLALVASGPKRRRSRHLLTVAAIAAAVSGLVATAVLVTRPTSGDGRVTTASGRDAGATGWYLPADLPAGWTLQQVDVERVDEDCPCRSATWSDPGLDRSLTLSRAPVPAGQRSPSADQFSADTRPVDIDLGPGVRDARRYPAADGWTVEWYAGTTWTTVRATGIDASRAEAVGRAFVVGPDRADAPVGGLDLIGDHVVRGTVDREVFVKVHLLSPGGHNAGYTLHLPAQPSAGAAQVVDVPGQPLELYRSNGTDGADVPEPYFGSWPGAGVTSGALYAAEPGDDPNSHRFLADVTEADLATLMASLRPATAARWHEAVAGADRHDTRLDDAETLADLLEAPPDA